MPYQTRGMRRGPEPNLLADEEDRRNGPVVLAKHDWGGMVPHHPCGLRFFSSPWYSREHLQEHRRGYFDVRPREFLHLAPCKIPVEDLDED